MSKEETIQKRLFQIIFLLTKKY